MSARTLATSLFSAPSATTKPISGATCGPTSEGILGRNHTSARTYLSSPSTATVIVCTFIEIELCWCGLMYWQVLLIHVRDVLLHAVACTAAPSRAVGSGSQALLSSRAIGLQLEHEVARSPYSGSGLCLSSAGVTAAPQVHFRLGSLSKLYFHFLSSPPLAPSHTPVVPSYCIVPLWH
jgi:hypothetical protein